MRNVSSPEFLFKKAKQTIIIECLAHRFVTQGIIDPAILFRIYDKGISARETSISVIY